MQMNEMFDFAYNYIYNYTVIFPYSQKMTFVLWMLLPLRLSLTVLLARQALLLHCRLTTTPPPPIQYVATANDEHSMETMVDKATSTSSTEVLKNTSIYKEAYIAALDQDNSTPKPTVLARE